MKRARPLMPAMTPTDEQALAALRTLRAWLGLAASAPTTFDAERLPPGITRDAFLRRHRRRWRARAEGWTRVGQARVVTVEAWQHDIDEEAAIARARSARTPRVRPAVIPATTIGEQLDAHLGIRTRRRAS